MSVRRPLQPLSPLSANIVGAKHSYITKVSAGANVDALTTMDAQTTDDNVQDSGSVVSGLTSVTGDDDFDRLMLQNARDEKRMQDALRGNIRPFSKARTHPRVGLTLDNLERNSAALGEPGNRPNESPGSSNGSTRSNPPYHPPAQWGRKGRVKRNWLRTITSDSEQQSGAQEDTVDSLVEDATPNQRGHSADLPLPSIEDSPLSHKGSFQRTPVSNRQPHIQRQSDSDEDYSIDFNEASLIASTPYMPRSHVLDDIRQREMESLKEQALTTNRLDRIREKSPAETRRPKSITENATSNRENSTVPLENAAHEGIPSEMRPRKRTNSWKTIGKSQAVTGQTGQQAIPSPITVYKKSFGTVGMVESGDKDKDTVKRPSVHRREDSHELLRRLARVSNTPSPGGLNGARPQTAPAKQSDSSSPITLGAEPSPPTLNDPPIKNSIQQAPAEKSTNIQGPQPTLEEPLVEDGKRPSTAPASAFGHEPADIDATPMPMEQSLFNAKTPKVTGAWVETPAPRTHSKSIDPPGSPSSSPTKQSPRKGSPKKSKEPVLEGQKEVNREEVEPIRPKLPKSALEAIVEEAKASGRKYHHLDSLGDSTIDSLEDLIAPAGEDSEGPECEDDTLQGLELPTEPPRNEAERQRQQELAQLHKMNQRLRAARTSIRDASRGMKRVESRVEHVGEDGQRTKVVYRDCPCAAEGHNGPQTSVWEGLKRMFRDPRIQKRAGLTWLSIGLLMFLGWFILEVYACDKYCHPIYASKMVGYGVNPDAPDFPFVIPTMLYRWTLKPFKPFWEPLWNIIVWMLGGTYDFLFANETGTGHVAAATTQRMASKIVSQATETLETVFSMDDDEVIY
ncbi:hypothetical protein B0J11DRAFT_516704 [Dendryphion nanum]|uniref:Uncharacterized protein n=1 Tax=Dendryphion nanum TaxID=256645 RepID=A0A9P9EJL9_9PLEO|nr:hypothetical protein B0J11DRAFT_516704 [Dendryphion nanum]